MKLKIFPFQNEVALSEEHIAVLQINNTKLFNGISNTFYLLSVGQQGEENIVVTDNNKLVDIEEQILFLPDLWHFDVNNKKIVTKLLAYIESHYKVDTELMEQFQQQLQLMQVGIRDITDELPFEIEMKATVTLQDVLKMLGIKLNKLDGCSLSERLITIMDIIEQFNLYSVIVCCNMKVYFEKNELKELYKHALHCKIKLMMLEYGSVNLLIDNEKVWYIDEDYEEFMY